MGMTLAILQISGNTPVWNERLYKCVRGSIKVSAYSLMTSGFMPLLPAALPGFKRFISFRISCLVTSVIKKEFSFWFCKNLE